MSQNVAIGWVAANDGNVSVKLPDGNFLVTPTGISKSFTTPEKLVIIDKDFNVVSAEGNYKPSSEIKMHMRCYEEREDVGAVVHAPSHDTASAVASCPIDDNSVFISSGTWNLIGTENKTPVLDFDASKNGFSNEGGIEYRFRFLENIIGMWFFQNIRKNLNKQYTYDEMMYMAKESNYEKLINTNDTMFLAPENMLETVREMLGDKNLPIADVLKSVYLSLAHSYDNAIKTIEKYSNKKIDNILIVGGGSKDKYLNELTSKITGKNVLTGLSEGTATGNLLSQIM